MRIFGFVLLAVLGVSHPVRSFFPTYVPPKPTFSAYEVTTSTTRWPFKHKGIRVSFILGLLLLRFCDLRLYDLVQGGPPLTSNFLYAI